VNDEELEEQRRRIAERVADTVRRREERAELRRTLARRRAFGLQARHAAKLSRPPADRPPYDTESTTAAVLHRGPVVPVEEPGRERRHYGDDTHDGGDA
jgi:hypothetical protein